MFDTSEIFNACILIVDDQEAEVLPLEQMLRGAGYKNITTTANPLAVYALHSAHHYDLILLDLQIKMDAYQVLEGLKEIEAGGYVSVLVMTAQPNQKLRALQAGAKDFIGKPFDLLEVQTRIYNMLEVRLLYKKLENFNKALVQTVQERTAELRESEARFKSFTALSSDWYWEQDAGGKFTIVSGPVFEMLGIENDASLGIKGSRTGSGWNEAERARLDAIIATRQPFLEFVYTRTNLDGSMQYLQVSGEPKFDCDSRFVGYRGIGMDITERMHLDRQKPAANIG
jgi:PAS domain S-box-containing protein